MAGRLRVVDSDRVPPAVASRAALSRGSPLIFDALTREGKIRLQGLTRLAVSHRSSIGRISTPCARPIDDEDEDVKQREP
jgi:hypothetical protein